MESLIQTINKLQDVFAVVNANPIDLPQIIVVGSQSSGKSSVLESLVGKSFLPRGTGIVTRAPLILQMIKYTDKDREFMLKLTNNDNIKEWACFSHKPNIVFKDFDEVRQEIENRTDILAGDNKGITDKPIVLQVYTSLYTLTFVDLPGITKIPVGNQPKDIDEQIEQLIFKYVQQSNSIILAVVTANTDIATSESLKIAKISDPEGARTIAVVTKLDLIDQGTIKDSTDLLCGKKIPVKLGIIGVVNRSQKDINENKTMEETLKNETEFLRSNYPEIYKNHGNQVLAHVLQDILIKHIQKTIPILYKNLRDTKIRLESEFKTLKTPDCELEFISGLLTDIYSSYRATLMGDRIDISDKTLVGGARIVQVINDTFVEEFMKMDPLQDLSDEDIRIKLLNTAGIKKSSSINQKALEYLVSKQLGNLIEPALSCVDIVRVEMMKIFDSIDQKYLDILKRFPKINIDIKNTLKNLLESKLGKTKKSIRSVIKTYQVSINTTNPIFLSELINSSIMCQKSFKSNNEKYLYKLRNSQNLQSDLLTLEKEIIKDLYKEMLAGLCGMYDSDEICVQVQLHKHLITTYFIFIRNTLRDFVPNCINHKLIQFVIKKFDKQLKKDVLIPFINIPSSERMLVEEEGVAEERQRAELLLNAVNRAFKCLDEIQCQ